MNQTWTQFKQKVDAAIERKGLDGSQVRIDFIWASGEDNAKPRISIRKRKKVENSTTHDLNID